MSKEAKYRVRIDDTVTNGITRTWRKEPHFIDAVTNKEYAICIDNGKLIIVEQVTPTTEQEADIGISIFSTGFVSGLEFTHASDSVVKIDAGSCRNSDDTFNITLDTKTAIDNTVSGKGGLDTGTVAADKWYAQFVIADTTGVNAVNTLMSLSSTAPTMPATHDKFRYIGWARTDATSDFIPFDCYGNERERKYFWQNVPSNRTPLLNGSATTPTVVDCSNNIPTTSTMGLITFINESSNKVVNVYKTTGGVLLGQLGSMRDNSVIFSMHTDQSLAYANSGSGGDATIAVGGFIDLI